MKKLLTIPLLMIVAIVHAQIKVGILAGYNASDFYTNASSNEIATGNTNGFQGGITVNRYWGSSFFIGTGLLYAQKGSYKGMGYQSVYGSNTTVKVNYLQVPINAGLLIKLYRELNLIASTGLYGAYGINGKENGTGTNVSGTTAINRDVQFTNNSQHTDENHAYIKPVDIGYSFGAGLSFKNIQLLCNYSKGFKNIYPEGSSTFKNEVWNYSIGYLIAIKK